jgi:BMFP domain-containing protein YqiC
LKEKVKVLQLMLASAREKNSESVEKIRWLQAKVKAQESDLERMNQKLVQGSHLGSGLEAPQWNMSYWKFEGPKLQQRVLELESELESLRSKTLWKD